MNKNQDFPNNMQRVSWINKGEVQWKHGRYVENEKVFCVGFADVSTEFYPISDVAIWKRYKKYDITKLKVDFTKSPETRYILTVRAVKPSKPKKHE